MGVKLAIAVMSFDRPQYLERVLQSVVAQSSFLRSDPTFFLFQDGAVSERTGALHADPEQIDAAREMFERYVPHGEVHASLVNLGVALNFDRAERLIFEDLGFESAIFLEDDLLLQRDYFRIVEELLRLTADRSDIGMVSARGYRNETPLAEQRRRFRDVCLMDEHNWGFAMHREAWLARDRALRPYLDVMRSVDYRMRDKGKVKARLAALQMSMGRHGKGYLTSQDSMKNLALEILGRQRITTFTNNARYIGKVGLHSNETKFLARGHHDTIVFDGDHESFLVPEPEELRRMRLGLHYR